MATRPIGGTDTQIALGRLFRMAREAAGMTLRQVAHDMGMSINTIRWHEAGTRCLRSDDLIAAARLIGTDPRLLIANPPGRMEAVAMLAESMDWPEDHLWKLLNRPLPKRARKAEASVG
jgi:transcriptional regulator with XRE-family HTH domain